MDLAILVWVISILHGITVIFGIAAAVFAFLIVATLIGVSEGDCEHPMKYIRWFIPAGVLCMLIAVVIPTQKTAYMMVGAYTAQKVAENPKVQDMSSKVITIIEQKLDGYIEDGLAEAEKKIKK